MSFRWQEWPPPPVTVFAPAVPHRMFFSKIMENYKILNPEKAPSWAYRLAGSLLNREIGIGFGEQPLLFPTGSGRTPKLVN